jgi:hypothetical protein
MAQIDGRRLNIVSLVSSWVFAAIDTFRFKMSDRDIKGFQSVPSTEIGEDDR